MGPAIWLMGPAIWLMGPAFYLIVPHGPRLYCLIGMIAILEVVISYYRMSLKLVFGAI